MKGFTLIELMIVVAIIAIIAAIAIPNMLTTRKSAWQTAAATFCRTAGTTAETYRIKAGEYPAAPDTAIAGATPGGATATLFEGNDPPCNELTPSSANTYTFTFTWTGYGGITDATGKTRWSVTATSTDTDLKSFYIDETGVLREGTTNLDADYTCNPYSG